MISVSLTIMYCFFSKKSKISENSPRYWEIKNITLGKINMIVGLNATGKTRLMTALKNLTMMISGELPSLLNGKSNFTFKNNEKIYEYSILIEDKKVVNEIFKLDGNILIDRKLDKGRIIDYEKKEREFFPPIDKLTLHVRRDKKEYPYLEDLFYWSKNYYKFSFSIFKPNHFFIGNITENKNNLESLSVVPHILEKMIEDKSIKSEIIKDMEDIGYKIEEISIKNGIFQAPMLYLKENSISCEIEQTQISSGMYRAFAMIVIMHYLNDKKMPCTFAVDDIGEGLDYDRSSKLTKLLLRKCDKEYIQLILTSNDRHLLNAIDVIYWNIIERNGHVVQSYNYENSKELFDEFMMTGLSNF